MKRLSSKWFTLIIACMLIAVTGCGKAESGQDSSGTDPKTETGESAAKTDGTTETNAASEDTVRVVKHVGGEAKIKGTPKRIVAIEWSNIEYVLALGVQPVGAADIAGFKKWVNTKTELAADVTDIGTRQEPNLEAIMALKPDLILTDIDTNKAIYDKLNGIAPTVMTEMFPKQAGTNQFETMERDLKLTAEALNMPDAAQKALDRMNAAFDKAKEELKAAGKEGMEYVLTQAFTYNNAVGLRLFLDNAVTVQVLNKIGLKNAYTSDKFEQYGFSTTTVEALPAVQKASLLYIVQDDDNVFENQLKDNPVWKGLDFVKENRTYALGGDTWTFGGPLSAEVLAEKAAAAITKK